MEKKAEVHAKVKTRVPSEQDLLVVTIVKAQDLYLAGKTSLNPLCSIKNSLNSQVFRTSVCKNTINPVWEESFQL